MGAGKPPEIFAVQTAQVQPGTLRQVRGMLNVQAAPVCSALSA